MASGGSRSFDFGSDDVLCSYDDFSNSQDPSAAAKRSDPSPKDFHESRIGPLASVYGQKDEYPKEKIIDVVEKCMKKYADNLHRHLEGISGRLSQLEIYCYKLERSIGEYQADMIRDQSQADKKLNSLEKHVQEVHRSIQILRDKQELAETQKELTKLQLAPKESASPTLSQKSEEAVVSSSISEPKQHEHQSDNPNLHLALALPHQIPAPPNSLPPRAPEQNQLPVQQQQPLSRQHAPPPYAAPHDYYSQNQQQVSVYPQQTHMQQRPQFQDSTQVPSPHQHQTVNQAQPPQPFSQYQQQWSQPSPQQFTQQVVAPTQQPSSQAQLARPRTPPSWPSEAVPFGYGPQPQQQPGSQSSFGPPPAKASGYVGVAPYPPQSNSLQGYNSPMYGVDGSRAQHYPPGSYSPQSNVPGNNSGFQHPGAQLMRSHPFADMIEKAVSMGYPRDQVVVVVSRMAESGQPVDFNALLDRLDSTAAAGGLPRAW